MLKYKTPIEGGSVRAWFANLSPVLHQVTIRGHWFWKQVKIQLGLHMLEAALEFPSSSWHGTGSCSTACASEMLEQPLQRKWVIPLFLLQKTSLCCVMHLGIYSYCFLEVLLGPRLGIKTSANEQARYRLSSFKLALRAWLLQEVFSGTLNFVQFSSLGLFAGAGAAAQEVIGRGSECVFWASLSVMPPWRLVEVCFKKEKLASHKDCESWALLQKNISAQSLYVFPRSHLSSAVIQALPKIMTSPE